MWLRAYKRGRHVCSIFPHCKSEHIHICLFPISGTVVLWVRLDLHRSSYHTSHHVQNSSNIGCILPSSTQLPSSRDFAVTKRAEPSPPQIPALHFVFKNWIRIPISRRLASMLLINSRSHALYDGNQWGKSQFAGISKPQMVIRPNRPSQTNLTTEV